MLFSILEQSLILGVMVLGVYITYRILDFPDLSADGTFPLGGAIAAILLVKGVSPTMAILAAAAGGAIAGAVTGLLHTKLKITNLLSGILVMTGLYSINLRIMGKSNIHLFSVTHMFSDTSVESKITLTLLFIVGLLIVGMTLFFKTKFGFILRALGDNENLVISLGVNEKTLKIIGLALGNSLIAISGALFAQYQGFADVGMGVGIIIIGLASIILGELVCNRLKWLSPLVMIIIGAILSTYPYFS